jgi:hypothetical protein
MGEKISDSRARDILSLLVHANTTANPRERLSDEEVLARLSFCTHLATLCADINDIEIPTFLVAGHETTSTLLSWILYRLSLHLDVQCALRAECRENPLPTLSHGNDPFDQDELNAFDQLPLLDAIIRETLRLHSPVPAVVRYAMKDDVLPLNKSFVDVKGEVRNSVPISKGDTIVVSSLIVQRSEELWGPDAKEWKSVFVPASFYT